MCKARHGSVSNALQAPTVASTVASTSDVKQTPAWGVAGFPARLPAAIYSEALAIYPDPFGDGPFQHFHLPNSGAFQPPAAPGPGPGAGLRHPLAPGRSGAAGRRPSNRGGRPHPAGWLQGLTGATERRFYRSIRPAHTTPRPKSGRVSPLSAGKTRPPDRFKRPGPTRCPARSRPRCPTHEPGWFSGVIRSSLPTRPAPAPLESTQRPLRPRRPARFWPPGRRRPAPGAAPASGAHRHAVGQDGATAPLFNG